MKNTAGLFLALALTLSAPALACASAPAEAQDARIRALEARISQLEAQIDEKGRQSDEKINRIEKQQTAAAQRLQSDWKIRGDARIRAIDSEAESGYKFDERVRIVLEKRLSPDTLFRMRTLFMDDNEMGTAEKDERARVDMAYFQFDKLGGNQNQALRLGRYALGFGSKSATLGGYDGVEFTTGTDRLRLSLGVGDWGANTKIESNYYISANYNLSKATNLGLWYMKETSAGDGVKDYALQGAGFKTTLGGDFALACDYWNNTAMDAGDKDGKWLTLFYKGAKYAVPHSYGIQLYYRDVEKGSIPSTLAVCGVDISSLGYKGPGLGFEYILRKNVKAMFKTAFATKDASTGEKKSEYYRFEVNTVF